MTLHVLHAGDGYTYLTRQVASGDVPRRRGEALTDYYTADGNPPGRWVGSGRPAMGVDGVVSEAQMKALFGQGLHPDADARIAAALASGSSLEEAQAAAKLGRRFPVIDHSGEVWRHRLEAAYHAFADQHGRRPERGPERDLIRWAVATELFGETQGREPGGDAELKAFVARLARPPRQPVAGVDLVFTPVKSVSVLWALGDEQVRDQVTAAHEAAWRRAFAYIEAHAALTRTGAGGIAQVDTNGLVAAAFDHPDSRCGDPNLHTHVAVSAKVQALDGQWRAWDLRVLHAMAVSASETYNTAFEDELRERLGVRFVERPAGRGRLPVREIEGIPTELLKEFSTRRRQVENGYEEALAEYRAAHGHDAPRHVQYRLAQQATLATRPAKTTARSWAAARAEWAARARKVLRQGPFAGEQGPPRMVAATVGHHTPTTDISDEQVGQLAAQAVGTVAESRSTWTRWHIRAEVSRLTRPLAVPPEEREQLVDKVTAAALQRDCLLLAAPELNPTPGELCRRDGQSVYAVHGAERYTSRPLILAVEDRLLAAAGTRTVTATPGPVFDAVALSREAEQGCAFDPGQVQLARAFVCDDRRLVAGVGPAGTGKTTAMRLVAAALAADGRRLVAVAPSARAAAVLHQELGVPTSTLAKLLHTHAADPPGLVPDGLHLAAGDVVLVDEAGMAGTPALGRLLTLAERTGALVRLLGDPMQLSAVEAGGALRLLTADGSVNELQRVHRFSNPDEVRASLGLRQGHTSALGFYEASGRLSDGSRPAMLEELYDAWRADSAAGRSTLMVASSTKQVAALSERARADRVAAGDVEADGVVLHDGTTAGAGDLVVTRANQRTLTVRGGRDFVKNGDLWRVITRYDTGELTVAHCGHGGIVTLPREYAAAHVELGYASTVHRAQGMTVDSAHVLVEPIMTRQALYVAMSRGRDGNHGYVVTEEALEVDLHTPPRPCSDRLTVLRSVLARDGAERSATETLRDELAASESLATLVPRYLDALGRAVARLGVEPNVRAGLRDAGGPDVEQRAADSPGWSRFLLACAGDDPRGVAAEAVRTRLLDPDQDTQDLGALLAWRVENLIGDPEQTPQQDLGRPPWVPAPAPGLADDPIGAWASEQDRLIRRRVAALVEQAASTPPTWANGIPARPAQRPERSRWESDMAVVAAYRDQHRIPDDVDLLTAGRNGYARGAYALAVAAARRLVATAGPPSPAPSVNQRLHALVEATRTPARHPHMDPPPSPQRRPVEPRPTPQQRSGPSW